MNQAMIDKAKAIIEDITREAKVGEEYEGTVSEVRESFAFVTLFTGTEGLLHVSEVSWERTPNIGEVLHVGDKVKVKVTSIDEAGKVKVSARECTPKPEGYVEPKKSSHSPKGKGNHFSHNNDSSSVERRVFKKNKEEA